MPLHFGKEVQPQNWLPEFGPRLTMRSFIGWLHLGQAGVVDSFETGNGGGTGVDVTAL